MGLDAVVDDGGHELDGQVGADHDDSQSGQADGQLPTSPLLVFPATAAVLPGRRPSRCARVPVCVPRVVL